MYESMLAKISHGFAFLRTSPVHHSQQSCKSLRLVNGVHRLLDASRLSSQKQVCLFTINLARHIVLNLASDKLAVVLLASRTLWRLVSLSYEAPPSLIATLSNICQALKRLEPPATDSTVRSSLLSPPHRAASLSSTSNDAPALYGEAVELAWQTAVTLPNTRKEWSFLTPRLLALPRAQNANPVAEWARRSLVSTL